MASIKDRLYKQASKERVPLTGAFELSPLCNFRCRMCYVRKTAEEAEQEGGIRPFEFWLDVARQAKEAGTVFPLLTGGKAFLYPHIRELYEAMCKMGMQVSINSNASCITEEITEWTDNLRYSPVCGNCVNRSVCFSCAAMVYNETGTFDGRPVYLCEKAKYAAKYYGEFMEKLPEDIRNRVSDGGSV